MIVFLKIFQVVFNFFNFIFQDLNLFQSIDQICTYFNLMMSVCTAVVEFTKVVFCKIFTLFWVSFNATVTIEKVSTGIIEICLCAREVEHSDFGFLLVCLLRTSLLQMSVRNCMYISRMRELVSTYRTKLIPENDLFVVKIYFFLPYMLQ